MSNQLAHETSPYLLQHANNPVDWFPWGPQAMDNARQQQRPIFLSIGYSACHWCHVMERESFENEQIAEYLNENFVCIKVDREERPDLDQIYMNAVQMMTGHGGWPMSVFLTPELQPFYGGTYWPPHASRGMPGFDQVLTAVLDAWTNRREQAIDQAAKLTGHLQKVADGLSASGDLSSELLRMATSRLQEAFDSTHGGFGRAPKFPHSMDLQMLLRSWKRWPQDETLKMVTLSLDKMARGGIFDHLAGGFARYSVDERWLVPHFEKMLYDNALLTGLYLDGYLITGNEEYGRVARQTLNYLLADMTDDCGGFHSTEDADSEGEEGKYYVWTPDQVKEILGEGLAERFCYVYGVTDAGNFEGKNILNLVKTFDQCAKIRGWDAEELARDMSDARSRLLVARRQRVRPGKDDKILVSWNGLIIDVLARASGIFHGDSRYDEANAPESTSTDLAQEYFQAASRAADFILKCMRRGDGRLMHSWRDGQPKFDGFLDDYTCLANGLISLYEASFEERWIDHAVVLVDMVLDHFHDPEQGGFFFTADDHEPLIARNKDLQDGSVPSGNSMAAMALLRLGKICGREKYIEVAHGTLQLASGLIEQAPAATGQMLIALDRYLGPTHEIVILGEPNEDDTSDVLHELRRRFLPNHVVACRRQSVLPEGSPLLDTLFSGREVRTPSPTVYICENSVCRQPVLGKQASLEAWELLVRDLRV